MTTILIADSNPFLAEGIKASLANTDLEVLEIVSTADSAINAYARLKPAVVICDIIFSDSNSISEFGLIKNILALEPNANILVFSNYDSPLLMEQADNLGAKAYLKKSVDRDELIKAIVTVAKGEKYPMPEIGSIAVAH